MSDEEGLLCRLTWQWRHCGRCGKNYGFEFVERSTVQGINICPHCDVGCSRVCRDSEVFKIWFDFADKMIPIIEEI
jgi:hypothetical protein